MIFTNKNVIEYGKAKNCHICERNITQKRIVCKGKAAHSYCVRKIVNEKLTGKKYIEKKSVVFVKNHLKMRKKEITAMNWQCMTFADCRLQTTAMNWQCMTFADCRLQTAVRSPILRWIPKYRRYTPL